MTSKQAPATGTLCGRGISDAAQASYAAACSTERESKTHGPRSRRALMRLAITTNVSLEKMPYRDSGAVH